MHGMGKSRLRKIVSILITVIFTVLIIILMACGGLISGLYNKQLLNDALSKSSFYQEQYESLSQQLLTLLDDMGMPESVAQGVLTEDQVYVDGKAYLNSALNGRTRVPDTTAITKKLRENISLYLTENQVEASQVKVGINQVVNRFQIDYQNTISFRYIDRFVAGREKCLKVVKVLVPITSICLVAVTVWLLMLYRHKHKAIRYLACGTAAGTILYGLFAISIRGRISVENLIAGQSAYQDFISRYLKMAMNQQYFMVLVGVIAFLVLTLLIPILRRQERY